MEKGQGPFRVKWAGGKRWLAPQLVSGLSPKYFEDGLCEPFAGGAALSFALPIASKLHLNDVNTELMKTYEVIRDAPAELAARLEGLSIDVKTFLELRRQSPAGDLERAARFVYLNKTAFAGLWRVNARGEFNVPFGCKSTTTMPNSINLGRSAERLSNAQIESVDFEVAAASTTQRFIYLDPPYTIAHNRNGFIRYNERLFSWSDQLRLAKVAESLFRAGKYVVVSNALHNEVLQLYRAAGFKLYAVERVSNLAVNSSARGVAQELLAVSPNVRFQALPATAERRR